MTEVEVAQEMTEAAIVETKGDNCQNEITQEMTGIVENVATLTFHSEQNVIVVGHQRDVAAEAHPNSGLATTEEPVKKQSTTTSCWRLGMSKVQENEFAKRNECFSCRTQNVGGPKRKGHHRSHRDPPLYTLQNMAEAGGVTGELRVIISMQSRQKKRANFDNCFRTRPNGCKIEPEHCNAWWWSLVCWLQMANTQISNRRQSTCRLYKSCQFRPYKS